jgi:hypothetical protein
MLQRKIGNYARKGSRVIGAAILCVAAIAPALAQAQTCLPPSNNDWTAWLTAQENAGGHAKACHVNVAVNGLIGRLEGRGGSLGGTCAAGGAAASAWSDVSSLLDAIKPVIVKSAATDFATGAAGNHVLTGTADKTIGTTVTAYTDNKDTSKNKNACPGNSSYVCTTTKKWTAVVQSDGNGGCFLLTAYPN